MINNYFNHKFYIVNYIMYTNYFIKNIHQNMTNNYFNHKFYTIYYCIINIILCYFMWFYNNFMDIHLNMSFSKQVYYFHMFNSYFDFLYMLNNYLNIIYTFINHLCIIYKNLTNKTIHNLYYIEIINILCILKNLHILCIKNYIFNKYH